LLELVSDLLEGLAHHERAAWRRADGGGYPPYVHGQQAAALASGEAAGESGGAQRCPRAVHADQDQRRAIGTELELGRWRTHLTIVPISSGRGRDDGQPGGQKAICPPGGDCEWRRRAACPQIGILLFISSHIYARH